MAFLKSLSAHTTCAWRIQKYLERPQGGCAQDYLERGERHLARDCLNIAEWDRDRWAETMDETRGLCGNDTPWRGKPAVTYRHFVISPDPADRIGLDALRSLACTWARRNFGDYEVAIDYHDDNERGIPHAHVIVNNTNLRTHRRLQLSRTDVRAIADDLQLLCAAAGLAHFDNAGMRKSGENAAGDADGMSNDRSLRGAEGCGRDAGAEGRDADARGTDAGGVREEAEAVRRAMALQRGRDARPSLQAEYLSKSEREIAARGVWTWKQQIRDWAIVAARLSDGTAEDFARRMGAFGVAVEFRAGGSVLYTHPDGGARRVSSERLGTRYSARGVREVWVAASLRLLSPAERDAACARLGDVRIVGNTGHVGLPELQRMVGASGRTLREAMDAMATAERLGATSLADLDAIIAGGGGTGAAGIGDGAGRDAAGGAAGSTVDHAATLREGAARARAVIADAALLPAVSERNRRAAAQAETRRRERAVVPLREKIRRGYRLTKEEHASLTRQQRRLWEANRRANAGAGGGARRTDAGTGAGSGRGGGTRGGSGPNGKRQRERGRQCS